MNRIEISEKKALKRSRELKQRIMNVVKEHKITVKERYGSEYKYIKAEDSDLFKIIYTFQLMRENELPFLNTKLRIYETEKLKKCEIQLESNKKGYKIIIIDHLKKEIITSSFVKTKKLVNKNKKWVNKDIISDGDFYKSEHPHYPILYFAVFDKKYELCMRINIFREVRFIKFGKRVTRHTDAECNESIQNYKLRFKKMFLKLWGKKLVINKSRFSSLFKFEIWDGSYW